MEYQSQHHSHLNNEADRHIEAVHFTHCVYYPNVPEVVCEKETVRLNAKQAAFLNYLIHHAGEKCHRQSIIDFAWSHPSTDKDPSFDQYLIGLRRLLGDTNKPHEIIIKTSEKGFYTLTSEMRIEYANKAHTVEKNNNDSKDKPVTIQKSHKVVVLVIVIIAFVFLGLVLYENMSRYKAIDYQPVTSLNGSIETPIATPDRTVAIFSHQPLGATGSNLMAKRFALEEYTTLVTGQANEFHHEPSLSPSGKQLAWIKNDYKSNAQCSVMIANFHTVDMSLSDTRVLLDCSVAYYGRSPQWVNEQHLLISMPQGHKQPNGIIDVDIVTGEQRVITSPKGEGYGEYALSMNVASNKLAYLRQLSSNTKGAELRVYDFSSQRDRTIKSYPHFPLAVTWLDDEQILLKGSDEFEAVSLNGESVPVVSNHMASEYYPASMGDNAILVVKGEITARDIQVIDLTTQKTMDNLSSIYHDYRAVIAKESEDITFLSTRHGRRQLFMADSQDTVQITQLTQRKSFSDIAISPNGQLVSTVETNHRLTIFNREGNEKYSKQFPFLAGIQFSTDGYSLLYSVVVDGVSTINRMSLADFSVKPMITGVMPKEDEKGNLYFFRVLDTSDKPMLYTMAPDGNITELFEVSFRLENSNSYDVIQNTLYYVDDSGKQKILMRRDLSTHDITEVTPITSTKFSLNKDATKLVTTKPGIVQNNLASFRVVKGEFVEVGD